jgi:hypothetical protein
MPYNNAPDELSCEAVRVAGGADGGGRWGRADSGSSSIHSRQLYRGLQDRGFPVWHPLPFQFPDDPKRRGAWTVSAGRWMLVAPIVDPGINAASSAPRGIWTHLETNRDGARAGDDRGGDQVAAVWARNKGDCRWMR